MGYDIYDGLNCSYLNNIKNTHLRLIILQGNKYCPINLRPFLGIEKGVDTKGMALFTQAYARLYSTTCDERFLKEMKCAIDYIIDHSGTHFDPKVVEAFLSLINKNRDKPV